MPAALVRPPRSGEYASPVRRPWSALSLGDKIELLRGLNERLKQHAAIEDWEAGLWYGERETLLVRTDGGHLRQRHAFVLADAFGERQRGRRYADANVRRSRPVPPREASRFSRRPGFSRRPSASPARRWSCSRRRTVRPGRSISCSPGSDDPADPRVDRSSARARPDSRRRAQLRGTKLRDARHVRQLSLRLRAAQRHVRSDAAWRARELRVRRRGRGGDARGDHSRRHSPSPARRPIVTGPCGPAGRGERPGFGMESPAHRPHGEPQPRSGDGDSRRNDRQRSSAAST